MDILLVPVIDVAVIALQIYTYILIASVILSWLVAFNVVNTSNQFVHSLGGFLYKVTEPALRPIRRRLPNFGGIDISPLVLILAVFLVQGILLNLKAKI